MNHLPWLARNPMKVMFFGLLTALTCIGFRLSKSQDLPDMNLPTIHISAMLKGVAPVQFETEVVHQIEDRLVTLGRLDHIVTMITEGSVSISVRFESDKNSVEALNEVHDAVDSVCADLTSSAAGPNVSSPAYVTFLSYTIEPFAFRTVAPRKGNLPGFVHGDCQLAIAQEKI